MSENVGPVPADIRALVERELVRAERTLAAAETEPADDLDLGRHVGVVFVGFERSVEPHLVPIGWKRSTQIAIPTTLAVVAIAIEALDKAARTYGWTADRLHHTAEHEITSIAALVFERFPDGWASLEDFRYALKLAAQETSWWQAYLDTREELSGTAVIPFSVQLQEQLDDLGWPPEELADRAKVDRRTVQRQLAGRSQPHRSNVRQYEAVLSDEKQEDVRFSLPPKRPETPAKRRPKRR